MQADKIVVYMEKNQINIYAEKYGMEEKVKTITVKNELFVPLDELLTMLGWKQTDYNDLMKIIVYERKPK